MTPIQGREDPGDSEGIWSSPQPGQVPRPPTSTGSSPLGQFSPPPAGAWSPPPASGWTPLTRDTSHNWMGVVSLVTGILGMIVFAYIFGFLGLNAVRRGQADNKMMSIGGIAVASMYILIIVLVAVLVER